MTICTSTSMAEMSSGPRSFSCSNSLVARLRRARRNRRDKVLDRHPDQHGPVFAKVIKLANFQGLRFIKCAMPLTPREHPEARKCLLRRIARW